jgi:hypothetical protein
MDHQANLFEVLLLMLSVVSKTSMLPALPPFPSFLFHNIGAASESHILCFAPETS